jgi:hypothetical protein
MVSVMVLVIGGRVVVTVDGGGVMVTVDGGSDVVAVVVCVEMAVVVLVKVVVTGGIVEVRVVASVLVKVCVVVIVEEHPVTIKRADKSSKAVALLCTLPLCIYFIPPTISLYFHSSVITVSGVKIIVNDS